MSKSTPTPLLTSEEAGEYLGVTAALLATWRYKKRGPTYIKVGHLVRYKREDLDEWIEENTEEGDR